MTLPAINSQTPNALTQLPPLNSTEAMKVEEPRPLTDRDSARSAPPVPSKVEEPPTRKMDVDENYDDDEPEQKEMKTKSELNSPRAINEHSAT
jgi:hypothetical protein